ncbi:type II secretion system F family protein [Angustibacter sp. McL0619]|uniref:type II secretion system F family protein n=1 Tax=Angustibacter sp. McL0619 TaxID=3415676 RepID=UPI003CF6AA80
MAVLLIPLATTAVVGLAVIGWRMARSTGLELVEGTFDLGVDADATPPLVARLIDGLGVRFQRFLLAAYGTRRLAALDRRLARAGRPEGMATRDFVRRQAGFAVIGVVAALFLLLAGQALIGLIVFLLFAGWMDFWLRGLANRRQAQIARELPDFLDVLAVTVTAGLSLQAALERVSSVEQTPLSDEVRRVLDDMRLGLARRQAFEQLRERNDTPSLGSWVTAMLQAEELGTPLSQALNDIAGEVRREAAQVARRAAAKATPKVSLVVTLVIVPGAILLIMSALVLSQIANLKGIFGG